MIPIRLYIYAGIALIAGLAYWRYDYVSNARDVAEAEVTNLQATLSSERANRKTEQEDRRQADESAKSLEAELVDIRSAARPVSVLCRPARVSAASEGGTAASAPSAATGDGAAESLRDIGAAVDAVRIEQQTNAARQRALIEWERSRTH